MRTILILLLFAVSGCGPGLVVSPVEDPLWLDKDQLAPYEGWLVTQGFMDQVIESTK